VSGKTHAATLSADEIRVGNGAGRVAGVAGAVGALGLAAAFALGYAGDEAARAHFFPSYLVSFAYFLSLCLGAIFFVLIQHLTRAGWSVVVRRIAEIVASQVLLMAVMAVPIVMGLRELYPWAAPGATAAMPLLQEKAAYLNPTFFLIRLGVIFAAWILLSRWFLARSVEQDRSGDPALTTRMQRVAAPAMFVFALTLTFASFDLLMSLEPEWFSTIFGVYFFAGSVLGFFAFLPVTTFVLQRAGRLAHAVTTEHYHDMGKLVFAFTVFWTYIAFSQYMLIWYANLPEETGWYLRRQTGSWTSYSWFLLIGHFAVPFLALISRIPKRRPFALVIGAVWVLFMHYVDLYYIVMPHTSDGRVPASLLDLACFVGIGGIFVATMALRMRGTSLVPEKDPRLAESLAFENY
jgi:hypothetical protein